MNGIRLTNELFLLFPLHNFERSDAILLCSLSELTDLMYCVVFCLAFLE